MSQSRAEQEVRSILDEAICASVTASSSGTSWEKIMTVIQMQRWPAEFYPSERMPKQTTHEVSIGDSINPFRPEILKLIFAMQFTGCGSQKSMIPLLEVENSANSSESPEAKICDNTFSEVPFEEFKSKVNFRFKCNHGAVKYFGDNMKQNDVLDDFQYLNKFNETTEEEHCTSLPSTAKTNIANKLKKKNAEELQMMNESCNNEYNSYLLSRYENEYNVNKIESSKKEVFFDVDVQNNQEESQYTEYFSYIQERNSSDYQRDYLGTEQKACCTPLDNTLNTKRNEARNKCTGDVQHSEHNVITEDSTLYSANEKISENHQLSLAENVSGNPPHYSPSSTYSITHEVGTEEKTKKIFHNETIGYLCDICHQRHTNKQCESIINKDSEPTASGSSLMNKEVISAVKGNESQKADHEICAASGENNEKLDSNGINCLVLQITDPSHQSPAQKSNLEDDKYASVHDFKKCGVSEHTTEYLFQNFIQPEDENNIKLLLVDNFSATYTNKKHENIQDKVENDTVCLNDKSETTKKSDYSLNCILQADKNSTISSESINEVQNLCNTNTSKNGMEMHMDENSNKLCQDKFSDKKIYWSSVGLVIEEIHDPNFLLVAGHSGELEDETEDSKVEDECPVFLDDELVEEQLQCTGKIVSNKIDEIEDICITIPVNMAYPTNISLKHSDKNGKPKDKGKQAKKSENKSSFFKSVRRILHLSRKH